MKYDFELDFVNNNSLTWIMDQIKKETTVLEFGPATGRLTKFMKEDLGCKVYLVEIDEESGKKALQYAEDLVVGDAERYEWLEKYKDLRFDHIIFADVLEHLRDPEALLVQVKRLLKVDGSILLSVPNVAHNSVLINLLNNKFEYTSVGLLDNTHIHLFTKESLEKMLVSAGLYIEQRYATYCKVGGNEIQNTIEDVPGIDKSYWLSREYGEVYQFVYAVRKSSEYVATEVNRLPSQNRNYYAQIFYSINDLKEDLSEKVYFSTNQMQQKYTLDVEKVGKKFRFDPLNGECVIKVQANGIKCINYNACIKKGEYFVFDMVDPIIEYEVEDETLSQIEIVVEYLSIDKRVVNAFGTVLMELNGREEVFRSEINNKLAQLEQSLVGLSDEKNMLQNSINLLNVENGQNENKLRESEKQYQEMLLEKRKLEEEKQKLEEEKQKLEEEKQKLEEEKLLLLEKYDTKMADVKDIQERLIELEERCNEKETIINDIFNSRKWRLINMFGRR